MLAIATSAKLFPLVVLPVVLAVRCAERRWRAAGVIVAIFAVVTVALNAPVAIEAGEGIALRESWTYFFEFSERRAAENTLWTSADLDVSRLNRATGVLLALGVSALVVLATRCVRRGQDVLVAAAGAALLWFFATSKVYSAQYALWIMLAIALAGLPVPAAIAFMAIDVLFFVTLWGGLPWLGDLPDGMRQIGTAALAVYVAVSMARAHTGNSRAVFPRREATNG